MIALRVFYVRRFAMAGSLIEVRSLSRAALCIVIVLPAMILAAASPAFGQAVTINTNGVANADGPIDRRYAQIEPTKIDLPQAQIDARGHQDILRTLVAEQGFAMRPLPRGKHGLTLAANGKLSPAGEGYLNQVTVYGLSVKPGDRVVLSNVKIDKEKMIFDINGGPERKHEFMRHVQIGMGGPNMTSPVVQDNDAEPTGSRVTLTFPKFVPNVTPAQIKALLAPLISFDMKTPVQAYTDTLPPKLKDAILTHKVMVGMSTDMVLFTLGQPEAKSREMDGQMPFEEWIYGHPPQDVSFVRINGNRVIRVEIAKLGQPLEVFTKDEVEGLMTTDGHPVLAQASQHATRTIQLGDAHPDLDKQAPTAPPTLRAPGEKLPDDQRSNTPTGDPTISREGAMKPVLFPKDTSNDPARTVQAHPAPAQPPVQDGGKTGDAKDAAKADGGKTSSSDKTAPDAKTDAKPDGTTAKPAPTPAPAATPPGSNFVAGGSERAVS
jgi:hypothetical protein